MRAQVVADAVLNAPAYTALYVCPHAEPVVSYSSMRTHVCIHIYIYIHTYDTYTHTYIHMYVCMFIYIYICIAV
jgi:hypothetical protein